MQKFTRADQLPLPDTRTLGQRVHGFMDANPQLGQNPSGGLPSRRANRLFQQLMQYYGSGLGPGGDIHPGLEQTLMEMGFDPDSEAFSDELGHLVNGFALEPEYNQWDKRTFNQVYDSQQPYGQQDIPNMMGPNPRDSDFYVDEGGDVFATDKSEDFWPVDTYVPQPGEEGFLGNAKNALMPLAKTAGSMALPMLFNMLLRGGK